jgi:hypothetical protein
VTGGGVAGWQIGARFWFGPAVAGASAEVQRLLPDALDAIQPLIPVEIVVGRRDHRTTVRKYRNEASALKVWADPATELLAFTSETSKVYDIHLRAYASIGFARPERGGDELREAAVLRSISTPVSEAEAFVERMVALFARHSGAQCGFVHAASNFDYLQIETRLRPGNPMIPETIEHTVDRFTLIHPHRDLLGEKIMGAHWGVFLGATLVEQLGGRERITREAPVHRVRVLDHGAVLLQLTPTPAPLFAPDMLAALPAFEAYLEPISIPIGPYFRRKIPAMTDGGTLLG